MLDILYTIAWFIPPILSYHYFSYFESLLSLCLVYFFINILPKFFGLEPMSSFDSLMFYETDTNKLIVTSIITFAEKITIGEYKFCCSRGLPKDLKLTSKVAKILGRYYWKKYNSYNLHNPLFLHKEQVSK